MQRKFSFSNQVLDWFDQYGRKNLPWQKDISPYHVWVSEIMLQQTQVKTVIPYFQRFISYFPTVAELAKAKEEEVLTLWAGLGYYARARNLYKTGQIIHQRFNDQFPLNLTVLQQLPGIGRSTAGAILAIAGGQKAAILDGNVKRVLSRFYGIDGWPGETKTLQKLWEIAEQHTPTLRTADYTQAMMDLGATVCGKKPNCIQCPLNQECYAFKTQTTLSYPIKKLKKQLPLRSTTMIIFQYNNKVLLKKRPSIGIWGGLWSFPECDLDQHDIAWQNNVSQKIYQDFGYEVENIIINPPFNHKFTHFQLNIVPLIAKVKKVAQLITEDNQYLWYQLDETEPALPAPVKKILAFIREEKLST